MTANINDKVTSVRSGGANANVTTVASVRSIGGTSLVCVDLSNWPTDSAVHFITYKKKADGSMDKSSQCDWKGIVSANTIGSLTLENGSDAGNAVGDFVEMAPTAAWAQDLHDGISQTLDTNGSLKDNVVVTRTIADDSVTSAKIDWSGFVLDSNGSGAAKTGITTGTYTYYTGMPSITFTLDAPGKVYVDGTTFIQNGTSGTMDNYAAVHLDGTKIGNDRTFTGAGSGNGGNIALPCSSTVAAGTHTLDVRVLTTGTMTVFPIRSYLRATIAVGA